MVIHNNLRVYERLSESREKVQEVKEIYRRPSKVKLDNLKYNFKPYC